MLGSIQTPTLVVTADAYTAAAAENDGLRRIVYQLKTSEKVGERIFSLETLGLGVLTIGCVAAAVYFIAVAPIPKPSSPATRKAIPVITVKLSKRAATKLGCHRTFDALQVGGTDDEPTVVRLRRSCGKTNLVNLTHTARVLAKTAAVAPKPARERRDRGPVFLSSDTLSARHLGRGAPRHRRRRLGRTTALAKTARGVATSP